MCPESSVNLDQWVLDFDVDREYYAARRAAADALRQAEAQAEAERQAMLDRTEKDCDILRAAAMARMDDAVDYLLEKVVKR